MRPLTFGSMFAGVGGFDLGFESAGFQCRWQIEWDQAAAGVLAYHWPQAKLFADITKVNPDELADVDVITFGFPCQDLSVAGKRKGLAGRRSGLFYEATRIIRSLRSRAVPTRIAIAENVPGLFSSHGGRDFAAVLGELAQLGKDCAWATLDSQFFGVPQRRDRVFIVVDLAGESASQILALEESLRGDFTESGAQGEETAGTLGALSGGYRTTDLDGIGAYVANGKPQPIGFYNAEGSSGATLTTRNGRLNNQTPLVVGALQSNGKAAGSATQQDAECGNLIVIPILEAGARTGREGYEERDGMGIGEPGDPMFTLQASKQHAICFDPNQITSKTNRSQPAPGGPMHSIPAAATPPLIAFSSKDDGQGCAEGISPSIQGNHSGVAVAFKPSHFTRGKDGAPSETMPPLSADADKGDQDPIIATGASVRRLTPLEGERCMGWPDEHTRCRTPVKLGNDNAWKKDFKTGSTQTQSDSARYRQIGNGVVAPIAKWLADQAKKVLMSDPNPQPTTKSTT